jgi:hypothetical protein
MPASSNATIRSIRQTAYLFLLVSAVVGPAAAQDQPDFSGRWLLVSDPPPPDAPRALSVQQAIERTNRRGEQVTPYFRDISIVRERDGGMSTAAYQIGIVGGTVSGTGAPGSRTLSGVKWEGRELVFESGRYDGSPAQSGAWTERREVWSLDGEGRLVIRTTTSSSSDRGTTVTSIYRRAPTPAPADFAVRFEFGVCTTDVLDTFNGVFVRDMGPRVPAVTVRLVVPSDVLQGIHDAVVAAGFFEYPARLSASGGDAYVVPAEHYRLEVRSAGKLHSVSWEDHTRPRSEDANRLRFLFTRIKELLAYRAELKNLPRPSVECL